MNVTEVRYLGLKKFSRNLQFHRRDPTMALLKELKKFVSEALKVVLKSVPYKFTTNV